MHTDRRFVRPLAPRLRISAAIAALICLACSVAAVQQLRSIDQAVARVARAAADEAAPALELMRTVDMVALAVAQYNRTRSAPDFRTAMDAFARANARVGCVRVALASADAKAMSRMSRETAVNLIRWRDAFSSTAEHVLRSERSVRGIAAQSSLLTTLSLQLAVDDGTAILGRRSPAHRKTCLDAVAGLTEVQNHVLLASSLLEESFVDRAVERHNRTVRELDALVAATAASDLHEFLAEVEGRMKDLADELASLRSSLALRNAAQQELLARGDATLSPLQPVVTRVIGSAVVSSGRVSGQIHRLFSGVVAAAVILPIVGFFAGDLVARRIARQLAPVSSDLAASAWGAAGESAVAREDAASIAEHAEQQAVAIRQLSGAAEELNRTTTSSVGHNRSVVDLAGSASQCARHGGESIAAMTAAMTEIASSAEQIASIAGSIDELAFQTNLLALNTAIEAARAGESGRGFGIVADEVRRLAGRSADAARQTSDLIDGARERTRRGVAAAAGVERDFHAITRGIGDIQSLLEENTASARIQLDAVRGMTAAVTQLRSGTAGTARRAAKLADFATRLKEHSYGVHEGAVTLAAFLGGRPDAAKPIAEAPVVAKPEDMHGASCHRNAPGNRRQSVTPNPPLVG